MTEEEEMRQIMLDAADAGEITLLDGRPVADEIMLAFFKTDKFADMYATANACRANVGLEPLSALQYCDNLRYYAAHVGEVRADVEITVAAVGASEIERHHASAIINHQPKTLH